MQTPKQIVQALDQYIIGQDKAKRAVAIALRNRYRRSLLPEEMREEIMPKNIIMIGPTGVGKTEIARRLAKLVEAPLVKVEATKFTEVGYVGRDVDSMVRDLVEASIRLCKNKKMQAVRLMAEAAAEQKLADLLLPLKKKKQQPVNPFQILLGAGQQTPDEPEMTESEKTEHYSRRERVLAQLRAGQLEEEILEIEVEETNRANDAMLAMGVDINLNEMMGGILPKKTKKRKVTVKEARRILIQEESNNLIDMDEVIREAIEKAEQDGIIFIDEIDKIAAPRVGGSGSGPDVSREGVQRDILPIVEGSTVNTKYGPVKTDYMLFIAAGAFHVAKVTDLIPELQGRFPIKVELNPLTQEDYKHILTQPQNAVIKQYAALLATDHIKLSFEDDALEQIAHYAFIANETTENIGARRLHTIIETLLDDISFNASGDHPDIDVRIDANYVIEHLKDDFLEEDLHRFIL